MQEIKTVNKIEYKNLVTLGVFKLLNVISSELIKTYGAVFIYISSGSLNFVFLYLLIYSSSQILTNLIFKKLFSQNPKLALILRVIPFLFMFGIFFIKSSALTFTLIISISNGIMNSFYFAPIDNINGQLKSAQKTTGQAVLNYFEYFGHFAIAIVSGVLLDNLNVKIVSAIGIFIYLTSTIIFCFAYKSLKSENDKQTQQTNNIEQGASNQKKLKSFKLIFKNYHPILIEGLIGLTTVLTVFWSVFAYDVYQSFTTVGAFQAIIILTSILGTLFLRKVSQKKCFNVILLFSILLTSIFWILRIFLVQNKWIVFAVGIILGFLEPVYVISTYSAYFKYYYNTNSRNEKLIRKDLYKKIFSLPIVAICFLSGSLLFSIPFVSAIFGVSMFKSKAITNHLNKNTDSENIISSS